VSSPDEIDVPDTGLSGTGPEQEPLSTPSASEQEAAAPAPAAGDGLQAAPEPGPAGPILAHLDALDGLDSRPLGEHADIYQGVHEKLQAALAEIDGN
jgi:hypothetical protein